MRRPFAVIAMLAVIAVAGCSSGSGPSASIPEGALVVIAHDYMFDPTTLAMTADQPSQIHFTNHDSEQHDIAIFPNQDSSDAMFDGENIAHGSIVYDVPAFEAGTYYFKCTIHPVMNGSVEVAP